MQMVAVPEQEHLDRAHWSEWQMDFRTPWPQSSHQLICCKLRTLVLQTSRLARLQAMVHGLAAALKGEKQNKSRHTSLFCQP